MQRIPLPPWRLLLSEVVTCSDEDANLSDQEFSSPAPVAARAAPVGKPRAAAVGKAQAKPAAAGKLAQLPLHAVLKQRLHQEPIVSLYNANLQV